MNYARSIIFTLPLLLTGCATAGESCSAVSSQLAKYFGSVEGSQTFKKLMANSARTDRTQKNEWATTYLERPDQTEKGTLIFLQKRAQNYASRGQRRLALADFEALATLPNIADDRREHFRSRVSDLSQLISQSTPSAASLDNATDATPLVRIPPIIPPVFLRRDNSGHCQMKFDVDATGKVVNATVEYCTDDVLREPALTSVLRWKYSPKIVDGSPTLRRGLRSEINFILQDACGNFLPE